MGPFSDPRTPPRETLAVKNVWAQIGRFHERHRDKGTVVRLYRLCQPFSLERPRQTASAAGTERKMSASLAQPEWVPPTYSIPVDRYDPRAANPPFSVSAALTGAMLNTCPRGLVVTVKKVPPPRFVIAVRGHRHADPIPTPIASSAARTRRRASTSSHSATRTMRPSTCPGWASSCPSCRLSPRRP